MSSQVESLLQNIESLRPCFHLLSPCKLNHSSHHTLCLQCEHNHILWLPKHGKHGSEHVINALGPRNIQRREQLTDVITSAFQKLGPTSHRHQVLPFFSAKPPHVFTAVFSILIQDTSWPLLVTKMACLVLNETKVHAAHLDQTLLFVLWCAARKQLGLCVTHAAFLALGLRGQVLDQTPPMPSTHTVWRMHSSNASVEGSVLLLWVAEQTAGNRSTGHT